jgi:hypothetical protein
MLRSDQWDIRINVPTDAFLNELLLNIRTRYENENWRYVHVSGVEVGDDAGRPDFGERHVHIALVLFNHTSWNSIRQKLVGQSQVGFYIAAREKTKSIDGWIAYHAKPRTKLDPSVPFLFQAGKLPRVRMIRSEEEKSEIENTRKKQKYDQWERRKYLINSQQWDVLDREFPGFIWTSQGQAMKREMLKQQDDEYTAPLSGPLKNFIIWGPSGTGKSSSISLLYPNAYKKQKGSQYWDAYDKTNPDHAVVWIDEMSKETLKTLTGKVDGGFEFLKELADRYAVTVDEKYTKGYKIRPKSVIITMNEHPVSLLPDRAVEVNKKALYRKFKILHVADWLMMNGLKCTPNGCRFLTREEVDEDLA